MEINPLEDIPIDIIKENFAGLIKKYGHYKVTG